MMVHSHPWLSLVTVTLLAAVAAAAADGPKVFSSADGAHKVTYEERIPAKPAAATLGLVLLFHGHTLNESSLIGHALPALQQAGIGNHYVVIGLKSQGVGWENRDDAPVRAFIQHALSAYPVDRRRVIGMGYSSGCMYITRFAQTSSDLFAGAIGYVGRQGGAPSKDDPEKVAELYWVTGHKDSLQPYKPAREDALKNIVLGLPVIYREEKEMDHHFLWGQSATDALAWMQHLRVKSAPLAADDAAFIESFQDDAKAKKQLADARAWARIVTIAGPQVGPIILQGLASDKAAVQNSAAIACSKVQLAGTIITTLGTLLEGKDKKLKGPVLNALMTHAIWNHPLAQKILCTLALSPAAAPTDRRAVALALGQVVKLDVQGACVYTRVLWTLVDLLDDDDATLRESAFTALEPGVRGGFGYQPGANKAGRAAAVEQWRAWVEKSSGPRPGP